MRGKITKRSVEAIEPGEKDAFLWDTELPGFGCKVTPKGSRVYLLEYWRGRVRRLTLGRHGVDMTAEEARSLATSYRGAIASGGDPAADRARLREVPTLKEFAEIYLAEHAEVKKKASSVAADRMNLRKHILPALGTMKLSEITRADVARFHSKLGTTPAARPAAKGKKAVLKPRPGAANRSLALLSKLMNLAEARGWRADGSNPTRHVQKFPERKLERFLSDVELARLGKTLATAEAAGEHPSVIAAVRLLVLTGCRRDEILKLKWDHVDFAGQCLRLPDSKTGAKVVPLGAPALELLSGLPRAAENPYVLPGGRRPRTGKRETAKRTAVRLKPAYAISRPAGHLVGLEKAWRALRLKAELPDVRLHDLRHSYASVGAAMGESLLVIGALLGHADATTTARYAHLSDDPRRATADKISGRIAAVMRGGSAEVVPLRSAR